MVCVYVIPRTSELLELKGIEAKPVWVAINSLMSLAGDKDVAVYDREDAKLLLRHLELKGNKSGTIRRRIVVMGMFSPGSACSNSFRRSSA